MERPQRQLGELALLYLSMVVARVGFGVIIIIFPSYLLGYSNLTIAVALALYPLMEAASAIPTGIACDKKGRKLVFVAGLGSMSLLTAAMGLTRNLFLVAGLHALMGLSAAAVTVGSLTMITDLTTSTNRGKGMGTFDFSNLGGYAVGLLIGGRLHDYFLNSLGNTFFVTAIALFGALALSLVFLKDHGRPYVGETRVDPLRGLNPTTKAILPVWLSLTCLLGIVFFLPKAFRDVGIRATMTGDVLFLGIAVLGAGSVGFGALSDRLGREKTMAIGVVGLFSFLATLGFAFRGPPSHLFEYIPLLAPSALATSALVPSILAAVGDRAREGQRGATMGIYSLMLSLGIALGELLAGFVSTHGGLPAILFAGAALFLLAAAVSFVLLRRVSARGGAPG